MHKRGFEVIKEYSDQKYITLPNRATRYSAGYDIKSAQSLEIAVGEVVLVPTGIKAYMQQDEVLKIYPRSSLSIKRKITLANNVGIIDADYYNNENNEGHILIPLYNFSGDSIKINQGERIAQGIFEKYLIIDDEDDTTMKKRSGGFGSSGK